MIDEHELFRLLREVGADVRMDGDKVRWVHWNRPYNRLVVVPDAKRVVSPYGNAYDYDGTTEGAFAALDAAMGLTRDHLARAKACSEMADGLATANLLLREALKSEREENTALRTERDRLRKERDRLRDKHEQLLHNPDPRALANLLTEGGVPFPDAADTVRVSWLLGRLARVPQ